MKGWLPVAVLILVVGCGGSEPSGSEDGAEPCGDAAPVGLEIGMCAPNFELPDSEGTMVSLSSFRGDVVLVDIAALW
jgi:cytochrome oxidase Cu insertion factor (SCO1/SenC/PrrC family)